MLDDLEPTVRTAIMKILSALYESGLEDEVDMGVVMQLFGVPILDKDKQLNLWISFDDVEFIQAYLKHKEENAEVSDTSFSHALTELDNLIDEMDEFEQLDLDVFDVEIVDMATGESTKTQMTRDELNEAADEGAEKIPPKTKRVYH